MKVNKLHILFVLVLWLATSCQSPKTPSTPDQIIEITREVVTNVTLEETKPVECTQPEGIALIIEPTSSVSAKLTLTGLQPGELPIFLFIAKPTLTAGKERQFLSGTPVGDNGELIYEESGLDALPDSTTNTWTIKVIHVHGVTCAEFTLP